MVYEEHASVVSAHQRYAEAYKHAEVAFVPQLFVKGHKRRYRQLIKALLQTQSVVDARLCGIVGGVPEGNNRISVTRLIDDKGQPCRPTEEELLSELSDYRLFRAILSYLKELHVVFNILESDLELFDFRMDWSAPNVGNEEPTCH
jgi:hypothetical protein